MGPPDGRSICTTIRLSHDRFRTSDATQCFGVYGNSVKHQQSVNLKTIVSTTDGNRD